MLGRMPAGYNHNVCYRSRIFHAQTEACGNDNPFIVTHLFLQGMVVASLRSGYRELLSDPALDEKLRKAMQEQHKEILRELRRGDFDARVGEFLEALQPTQMSAAPALLPPDVEERAKPMQPLAQTSGLQPLAQTSSLQPEPLLQPLTAAELTDEPITEAEQWVFERGRSVSLVVGAVPVAGGRIPLDHPAFEGFPMLELDLGGDEALELDLEAISELDLDAGSSNPIAAEACLPDAAPEDRAAPPAPRRKPPSLPLAPVAVELSEGIDIRPRKKNHDG